MKNELSELYSNYEKTYKIEKSIENDDQLNELENLLNMMINPKKKKNQLNMKINQMKSKK